jgi:hypothetical protein
MAMFYGFVPGVAIVLSYLAFAHGPHGSQLKWVATIYTMFWLLVSRLVQNRSPRTVRGRDIGAADIVALVWLVSGLTIVGLALADAWPGVLSLDPGSSLSALLLVP